MSNRIAIEILKPGSFTSLPYPERYEQMHYGIPIGGPCDKYNATLGRWLLHADTKTLSMECTEVGPTLLFHGNCQLAFTGAPMDVILNNTTNLPFNKPLNIESESIVKMSKVKQGYRTYLTINGSLLNQNYQFISPRLNKDQILELETKSVCSERILTKELIPTFSDSITIRYLPGPEFDQLSETEKQALSSRTFTTSNDSNRMGIKLREKFNSNRSKSEMISSGVIPGTIQLTNDQTLIILLNDAQTTGGYPRIANIISADMDKLGQAAPGTKISFVEVDLDMAHKALSLYKENLSYFLG